LKTPPNLKTPPSLQGHDSKSVGRYVTLDGEAFYRISDSQQLAPFFMSLVSPSDHWMFIASNGAVTAGRQNPDNALFPYYSADKLIDQVHASGPLTIIRTADAEGRVVNWEPFTGLESELAGTRALYKNISGSKLHLEEINPELGLIFRYSWEFSDRFGIVRTCHLANVGGDRREISMVDGIQNILPYGINEMFQLRYSNLGDAYKKNELINDVQLGVYYLSSIPTDCAEPSEGLRATVVWQAGLSDPKVLLSEDQLARFREGRELHTESEVRGKRGAYFVNATFELSPNDSQSWTFVADLKHDQTDVANLVHLLKNESDLQATIRRDIRAGQEKLKRLVSAADGIQVSNSLLRTHRHQSNVIFNLMRGGTPFQGYQVSITDFVNHVRVCNRAVYQKHHEMLSQLGESSMELADLLDRTRSTNDPELNRIANEYLPFTFGRRHGDPTRPWNRFSIEIKNEDGSQRLNYQGNWRDIFQNWEALAVSYPAYLNGMVRRFVNASTADGYNPYRITKDGFDWEKPDPEDPWANIGYWGDHQIVYLQKLLEWSRRFSPNGFRDLLTEQQGVYAELPYRIRNYQQMLQDANNTIDYDREVESQINARVDQLGSDGQLLTNRHGTIQYVSLAEKLLLPALVKMSNFVPGGGIWLNTQRPEWNDANNALVGNGASVVTVCYLRRYFSFLKSAIEAADLSTCRISREVISLFEQVGQTLQQQSRLLDGPIGDRERREFVDQLQQASSSYRDALYHEGLSGDADEVQMSRICDFADRCIQFLDHTIRLSRRDDGLYQSYNLLKFTDGELQVEHLYEMLEGQVAVIGSELLTAEETTNVLAALRNSPIYREDINTYMLYPDRDLPRFMEKNCLEPSAAQSSPLIQMLVDSGVEQIVRRDTDGAYHFNGDFRNAADLENALRSLGQSMPKLRELIDEETARMLDLFEQTFQHHRFTGRSGTFFGYEGLGSVYWHMVSKLALAVLEAYDRASQELVAPEILSQLKSYYREIRDGLGLESSPEEFGAFPIDPYSHTPQHAGAQQPGMTGQVKEDVLSRIAEIGVRIREGIVVFDPSLFEGTEFLTTVANFSYEDMDGNPVEIQLAPGCFAFTLCQVPVIYQLGEKTELQVFRKGDPEPVSRDCNQLTAAESHSIFMRDKSLEKIVFSFAPSN
jgi:hypothetical protein